MAVSEGDAGASFSGSSYDEQFIYALQGGVRVSTGTESELLEVEDLFDGSRVVEARTTELAREARAELERVLAMGGAVAAVENAYMKQRLVESHTARLRAIAAAMPLREPRRSGRARRLQTRMKQRRSRRSRDALYGAA